MNKFKKITAIFFIIMSMTFVFAVEDEENSDKLESLVKNLNEYSSGLIDTEELKDDLLKGDGLDYKSLLEKLLKNFFKEMSNTLRAMATIVVIVILNSVIKSLELEKEDNITKVATLISFLAIIIICTKNYIEILQVFTTTIGTLCKILGVASPVLLVMLISTGTITTTGIIGPLILFISTLTSLVVNTIIITAINISLIFKIITSISSGGISLNKLSKTINSASMWLFSILFAVILGLISMLSSVSTSADEVVLKTTKAAVSVVPVVGKFVADSTEAIASATELIGKTGGVIAIITLIVVSIIPVIKIGCSVLIYTLTSAIAETLNVDKNITDIIESFKDTYKTLLGMLVGVITVFTISLGIIISLMGKVVG